MQVTQVNDHVTHAVITGNQAINVMIDDSPEFFHILSSTLYSDQILAIVRETLCNAWDAHVEAGCTDRPIEVDVKDGFFYVRDFGLGIPKDKVQSVYGVYGRSTKKANGAVTGGFGLGCKAPWAYQDTFEVTIWNAGFKTIYQMSKSNAEVNGKPSILPIVSIPCGDETGLQVKLKINAGIDSQRFLNLSERIIRNGGMNGMLNGRQIDCLPFDKMEHNFLIVTDQLGESANERLYVRYGHVIYPIPEHTDIRENYRQCLNILSILNGNDHYSNAGWKLIVQAPPHSISVTPSRETLSMQPHTIKTLNDIMSEFINNRPKNMHQHTIDVLEEGFKKVMLKGKPSDVMTFSHSVPGLVRNVMQGKRITSYRDFTQQFISYRYPDDQKGFWETDLKKRYEIMEQFCDRGLVQSYRRFELKERIARNKLRPRWESGRRSSWLHSRILAPIRTKMAEDDRVSYTKLCLYTQHPLCREKNRMSYSDTGYIDAAVMPRLSHEACLPYTRKIVILAFNRQSMDRANEFPIFKHWLGSTMNTLVYVVPRSPDKIDRAREFWQELGYRIVDLTKPARWETPMAVAPIAKVMNIVKPRKKGIPMLSAGIDPNHTWLHTANFNNAPDEKRIANPKVVMKYSTKNGDDKLPWFSHKNSMRIATEWGDQIGIVSNTNQEDKYVKTFSSKRFVDFMLEELKAHFSTPDFQKAYAFDYRNSDKYQRARHYDTAKKEAIRAIWHIQKLKDDFKITHSYTDRDKLYVSLWRDIKGEYNFYSQNRPLYGEVEKLLSNIKIDPVIDRVWDKIENSKLLSILDMTTVVEIIANPNGSVLSSQRKEKIIRIFCEVLEG